MKKSTTAAVVLVCLLGLTVLGTFGAAVLDLRQDRVTRDLWTWTGRAWTGLCGLLPLLIFAGLAYGLWQLGTWLRIRANLVHHRAGQLPASANPKITLSAPHRNEQAEIAQALASSKGGRLNAASVRAAFAPPKEPLQLTAVPALTAGEVLGGYDPEREPHWLLIGATGAGKSHVVYNIVAYIARRYNSQFLIAEKDAVGWNQQAAARTLLGYAELLAAVEVERQRRVGLLRAADVDHIVRLPERLPLLVVVLEEAESIYGRLYELDRERAHRFVATLRDITSQGRKQGIALVVATQTGTRDVFDANTRRNLGNTLIMRSEAVVGDQFGVPRSVGLPTLPSGTAWSLKHGRLVGFPQLGRPVLPLAQLYREEGEPLRLVADAEADGLGEDDIADGVWYTGSTPPLNTGYSGIQYRVPGREAPLTDYDEALHRRLWAILQAGSSLKGAQTQAEMRYQGGTGFYLVRRIQELGEQGTLPWMVNE